MISVDPEASKEAIKAFRDIFQSFGSTRLLGYGLLILGILGIVGAAGSSLTADLLELSLWAIIGGFAILAISYIMRPHDINRPKPKHPNEGEKQP